MAYIICKIITHGVHYKYMYYKVDYISILRMAYITSITKLTIYHISVSFT